MGGWEELAGRKDWINAVDWDMTPEEAVTLYLEWGNNWSHGRMVRSKSDESLYFVVNTWSDPPMVYLVHRNSEAAVELAGFELPEEHRLRFLGSVARRPGVYAPDEPLKDWLRERLEA